MVRQKTTKKGKEKEMKVLIWDMFELRNTGGPSGYLYNIHEYLKTHPNGSIYFLSDLMPVSDPGAQSNNIKNEDKNKPKEKKSIWQITLSRLNRFPKIKSIVTKTIDYTYRLYHLKWTSVEPSINLNEFDFIHFHFLIHVKQFKNTYPNYRGKTIVTSHTPCPWTYETIDADPSIRYLRSIMIRQECRLYRTADYLMFPCKQAKEPYEHNRHIKSTLNRMESRTFYVPTSIIHYPENSLEIPKRSKFNIPESAFIVAFFGRHSLIKGYDILKKIAEDAFEKIPNLYFLCAGGGDIEPMDHPRWIELGYISNVKEIMQICDMYVLPNRETYFDLVVLECLRAGLPLSVSNTGGNKYFKTLASNETQGISYFDISRPEEAVNQIEHFYTLKKTDGKTYNNLRDSNVTLYNNHFTLGKYIKSYIDSLTSILNSDNL